MPIFMQTLNQQKSKPTSSNYQMLHVFMALIFLFLNIRSLHTHKPIFETLLLEEKVNAFILNETHLKPSDSCKISRYHMLRHDNLHIAQRANGGTAIGFSPKIAYRQHHPGIPQLPEHLITTIYYQQLYITIATIYIRPHQAIPNSFFTHISNNHKNYIIMADINIHSRTDKEKSDFHDFINLQTTGIIHQLSKPTRPCSNTTPDVVITSMNIFRKLLG